MFNIYLDEVMEEVKAVLSPELYKRLESEIENYANDEYDSGRHDGYDSGYEDAENADD